ncbi:hypothetical protein B9081_019680 [Citrobacter werkmanii]|nr:hypothetical protein B9081_019680 [Citrobacter werkmanii]
MPDGAAAYPAYRLYRFVGRIRCLRCHLAIILIRSSYKFPQQLPAVTPLHEPFRGLPVDQ